MKRKIITLLVLLMVVMLLTGCNTKPVKACYTVYPIEYILNRVAGSRIEICKLSTEDPIQVASVVENRGEVIEGATLFLQIGNLAPFWGMYADEFQENDPAIIDLAAVSALYDFKRYTTETVAGNQITIESSYYDGDVFSSIDMYTKDPNLWLDPMTMTSMARTIKDWLVSAYPEEASYFETNFKELEADLVRLDSHFSSIENANIKIVTVTPSFGNWQRAYNVGVYPLILSRFGALPTEDQLALIIERIKADEVKYITLESNIRENVELMELYNRVKNECGLEEIELSNLSTLTQKEFDSNKDYLTIMYDNLTALENIK